MTAVEPLSDDLRAAGEYYDSRTDLDITPEEKKALIHTLARVY